MSSNRRDFLKTSAALSAAFGVGLTAPSSLAAALREPHLIPKAPKSLRILILGGTGFIGPNMVRYAIARGHKVTLFNRGKTHPGMFKDTAGIDERIGDRAPNPGNYDSLKEGEWDVVIDNPTMYPRWVREAAVAVKGRAKQYVFISTISVYATNDTPGADETAAVLTTNNPDEELTPPVDARRLNQLYGPLKALSEQEAEKAFPGHATIIRPGLIVGVGDTSDRFTYWPVRLARGGEVLAPPADDVVQIIDARDLGEWAVRCCENDTYGVFNATGPAQPFTVRNMLEGIQSTIKSGASITYATSEFLNSQQPPVRGWSELPTWIAPIGPTAGFSKRNISKAISRGLTFRPFPETVTETLAFFNTQTPERQAALKSGIKPEREAAVLAAWHAKQGG